MFIVYVLNRDNGSWDYRYTLYDERDVMSDLIELLYEVEKLTNQELLIQCLIDYKRYIGDNMRIYYVDSPEYKWG